MSSSWTSIVTSILENGTTGYGVFSLFRVTFCCCCCCWVEFSNAISKGSFASVRIMGNSPLLGLLISQGLFSEDGICYVLTAHFSATLYICGVVCYSLAYDLCDSTKTSWVQGLYCLRDFLFVMYHLLF